MLYLYNLRKSQYIELSKNQHIIARISACLRVCVCVCVGPFSAREYANQNSWQSLSKCEQWALSRNKSDSLVHRDSLVLALPLALALVMFSLSWLFFICSISLLLSGGYFGEWQEIYINLLQFNWQRIKRETIYGFVFSALSRAEKSFM